jgi:phage tail sheath protein FI
MPTYLTPGVYVEEIERGPKPIEGVPTNVAAFLGEAERGPLRPRLLTSYNDYIRWFGQSFDSAKYLPNAASGFFANNGTTLYACRLVGSKSATATMNVGGFALSAVGPGVWGNHVWVQIVAGTTTDVNKKPIGFRLQVAYWSEQPGSFTIYDPFLLANRTKLPRPQWTEDYDDLQVNPLSADYFDKRLRDTSTNQSVSPLITVQLADPTNPPTTPPAAVAGAFMAGGADDPTPLNNADYIGKAANARTELQGLQQLELDPFRDVSIVHAPYPENDQTAIALAIIDHCERMRFRVAVIDGAQENDPGNLNPREDFPIDSSYAAFYAPWITTSDPLSGARINVPPGGYVVGIYARSDDQRGVFKAPANEVVNGALDVRFQINDITQGVMNPRGVNAIRRFPDRGIRVWGARTLSSDTLWKYVSVRRLFVFLERSIYEGTQWVVFEPNDQRLWARVKDTIRLFLRSQWRQGALFGATEDEAFFITCDRTTMSQDDILNGRLICEIGIAPVRPAEFVIFRIFQNTAESQS